MKKFTEIYDKLISKLYLANERRKAKNIKFEEAPKSLEEKARELLNELGLPPEPKISIILDKNLKIKPGSAEAQVSGCICDVEANTNGKGLYLGLTNWESRKMFAVAEGCPIHNEK